jgi:hypothetical protein
MDCNGVCESDFSLIASSAFQIVLAVLVLFAASVLVARTVRSDLLKRRAIERAREAVLLQQKIERLADEIAALPSPPLTPEGLPRRFPSRAAAQAFGERWSRGGAEAFSARDSDPGERGENGPLFDRIDRREAVGILHPTPALFFGMDDPYRDDDGWYVEFLRAKKSWLENYSSKLRDGVRPY